MRSCLERIRLQRDFAAGAGNIQDIAGKAEARDVAPELFHNLQAFPYFDVEMIRAFYGVALEQIIGSDGYLLEAV